MNTRDNLIGTAWMVFSMALFAVEDSLLKLAFQTMPIGQALVFFGGLGSIFFIGWALVDRRPVFVPEMLSRLMISRFVFEVIGRLFFFLAIAFTSLSSATIILQATPILVVATASKLFGETVGPRRWAAIIVGFIGVLIVLRPGSDAFTPLSILAIIGLIGFAGRDLTSRMAPQSLGMIGLGITGFIALTTAGASYALWAGEPFTMPTATDMILVLFIVAIGIIAYTSLMKAMRTGDVSSVTPFRYTRLIFGVSMGVIVFGETLDPFSILGSGLIVLSGLFILWRGRQII